LWSGLVGQATFLFLGLSTLLADLEEAGQLLFEQLVGYSKVQSSFLYWRSSDLVEEPSV